MMWARLESFNQLWLRSRRGKSLTPMTAPIWPTWLLFAPFILMLILLYFIFCSKFVQVIVQCGSRHERCDGELIDSLENIVTDMSDSLASEPVHTFDKPPSYNEVMRLRETVV